MTLSWAWTPPTRCAARLPSAWTTSAIRSRSAPACTWQWAPTACTSRSRPRPRATRSTSPRALAHPTTRPRTAPIALGVVQRRIGVSNEVHRVVESLNVLAGDPDAQRGPRHLPMRPGHLGVERSQSIGDQADLFHLHVGHENHKLITAQP